MTEQPGIITSITAAADVSGRRFIDHDGNHANAEPSIGVSQFGVKAGEQVPVTCTGIAVVECGGDVTKGGLVKADSAGKAVNLGAAGHPLGRALDAGSNGSLVRILLALATPEVTA